MNVRAARALIALCVFAATRLTAEPVAPMFFHDAPRFSERPFFFSSCDGWMVVDQVLNQDDSPWFGHDLQTGTGLTVFSLDFFALRIETVETFQFRVHPESEWLFWGRGILTDLLFAADYRLPSPPGFQGAFAGLYFRHDCRHDVDAFSGRSAVHDAAGLSLLLQPAAVRPGPDLLMRLDLRLTGELYLGQVFQVISPEPDQSKLALEARWIPLEYRNLVRLVAEGRVAILAPGGGTEVEVPDRPQTDYRFNLGAELTAGKGRFRAFLYEDRMYDPWITNKPEPVKIFGFGIAFIYEA